MDKRGPGVGRYFNYRPPLGSVLRAARRHGLAASEPHRAHEHISTAGADGFRAGEGGPRAAELLPDPLQLAGEAARASSCSCTGWADHALMHIVGAHRYGRTSTPRDLFEDFCGDLERSE
jgi:hypothetical protein